MEVQAVDPANMEKISNLDTMKFLEDKTLNELKLIQQKLNDLIKLRSFKTKICRF